MAKDKQIITKHKQSNSVIFHPFQRKPDYNITLKMYDNDLNYLITE